MKVSELIEILKTKDQDAIVIEGIEDGDGGFDYWTLANSQINDGLVKDYMGGVMISSENKELDKDIFVVCINDIG